MNEKHLMDWREKLTMTEDEADNLECDMLLRADDERAYKKGGINDKL